MDNTLSSHQPSAEPDAAVLLSHTDERMLPAHANRRVFWEHIYRYRFAARLVRGARVLDIACGEGYGTAALAGAGARSVLGVDVSREICKHADRRYGVKTVVGSGDDIPLASESIDVIVSFETIEHLTEPERFLDECRRVLAPGGKLIISTPNREIFNRTVKPDPFHCSELNETELVELLRERFNRFEPYSQRTWSAPWWNFRAFGAMKSPYTRIKGFGRLRQLVWRTCIPTIVGDIPPAYRREAPALIRSRGSAFATIFSPYNVVRRFAVGRAEQVYLIAIAYV